MITEVLLGTGLIALMLVAGGGGSPSISDTQRDSLWVALCAQWRNGLDAPESLENALAASGLQNNDAAGELAAEFWDSIRTRSAGNRAVCPPPPWSVTPDPVGPFTTGELPPPPSGGAVGVYEDYLAAAPGPNSIVQVTQQNGASGLSGVAASVVKAIPGATRSGAQGVANRVTVMRSLARSKWNLPYRLPRSASASTITQDGVTFDVRGAFYPANVNVVQSIGLGRLPRRNLAWSTNVVKTGAGSSYGALFVPEFSQSGGTVLAPSDDEAGPGMLPSALLTALGVTAGDIVP